MRLLLGGALLAAAGCAQALDDQWYVGLGASAAELRADAEAPGFDSDEDPVIGGTLFVGRDLNVRSSVQLQLHELGETAFASGETVSYTAGDASIIYRFVASRDHSPQGQPFGASIYGRFGLGLMWRDSDVELEHDGSVYFGAGAGVEVNVTRHIAFRAEGIYHVADAASANLSVVARFGGQSGQLPVAPRIALTSDPSPAMPAPAPALPDRDLPATYLASDQVGDTDSRSAAGGDPGSVQPRQTPPGAGQLRGSQVDSDGDGVPDSTDVCLLSAPGFPILDNGCALLDGVLSSLQFAPGTADFLPGAQEQLDYLADLLNEYPQARIELIAHTDDSGTVRDQAILARSRLRALGMYLVYQKRILSNRLVLRSFGGTRPIHDNASDEGRRRNNRIEVQENTS